MPCNFEAWWQTFRGGMFVAEILFVLPERVRFNINAEVLEFLGPFVQRV